MTMKLVSTVTVGAGGAASIEFTSIPQTGTDLLVVVSARGDGVDQYATCSMRLNSISTNSYFHRYLEGYGTVASSSSTQDTRIYVGYMPSGYGTASTFSNASIYIPNYSTSGIKNLSIDSNQENNATNGQNRISAVATTSSFSAITSLTLLPFNATIFVQYSTASLYTITKGSGGATVS